MLQSSVKYTETEEYSGNQEKHCQQLAKYALNLLLFTKQWGEIVKFVIGKICLF